LKKSANKIWLLIVLLIAGAVVGSVLWLLALQVLPASWDVSLTVGTTASPWVVDLHVVSLALGVQLKLNPGGAAGLIAVLLGWFFRR
jgi:hypothetical protein